MKQLTLIFALMFSFPVFSQRLGGKLNFMIDGRGTYDIAVYRNSLFDEKKSLYQFRKIPAQPIKDRKIYPLYKDNSLTTGIDKRKTTLEITNTTTKEKMMIEIITNTIEADYNLIVPFRKGHYSINLTALFTDFYTHFQDNEIFRKKTNLVMIRSEKEHSRERDWEKITDMEAFRIEAKK